MSLLKTAYYVSVGRYKNGGVLGAGSKQIIIDDEAFWSAVTLVLYYWIEPSTPSQVFEKIIASETIDKDLLEKAFDFVQNHQLLMEDDVYHSEDRYSRNKLYYHYSGKQPVSAVQQRLEKSHVTLIGCGGIGNHLSAILATAGVGKLTLVDPDTVELSNLTRQVLFTEKDISKNKVDVLAKALKERNNSITIETINGDATSEVFIKNPPKSDLWIISADSPSNIMAILHQTCVKEKQAYINVGYINDVAVIGPFYIPNETPEFDYDSYTPSIQQTPIDKKAEIINRQFKPASYASVNNTAAAFAANDILKFLGNFGEILSLGKRLGIHTNAFKLEIQPFQNA